MCKGLDKYEIIKKEDQIFVNFIITHADKDHLNLAKTIAESVKNYKRKYKRFLNDTEYKDRDMDDFDMGPSTKKQSVEPKKKDKKTSQYTVVDTLIFPIGKISSKAGYYREWSEIGKSEFAFLSSNFQIPN